MCNTEQKSLQEHVVSLAQKKSYRSFQVKYMVFLLFVKHNWTKKIENVKRQYETQQFVYSKMSFKEAISYCVI